MKITFTDIAAFSALVLSIFNSIDNFKKIPNYIDDIKQNEYVNGFWHNDTEGYVDGGPDELKNSKDITLLYLNIEEDKKNRGTISGDIYTEDLPLGAFLVGKKRFLSSIFDANVYHIRHGEKVKVARFELNFNKKEEKLILKDVSSDKIYYLFQLNNMTYEEAIQKLSEMRIDKLNMTK